ncbi:tetratricopeptide repeat protein [Olsenella uli]|uniref:tetratricopeptide repeat protein n=1 Tax=Olsenella uli TaxID=133926 RepID=UPI00195D4163|nr:tetratricopeptide repeat protein [Olsenella uli]MBM6817449.1 tetratricopeptide repeat protein [Olsenella uli]
MAGKTVAKAGKQEGSKRGSKKRERKPGELSRFQKVVIVLFICVFALSTLAGALASVFQGQQTQAEGQSQEDVTIESLDEDYQPVISDLEAKVAENAEDTASLLALGRYYFSWGASVAQLAQIDSETSHANELLGKAVEYYDKYLALEDSDAARVDRALCFYYEGDTTTALNDLEQITQSSPDYAPAWANLGMLYEVRGDTDNAKSAYQKAAELDPNDDYSAKSFAEQRLDAIAQAEADAEAQESLGTGDITSSTGNIGDDLTGATGTGL